MLIVRLERVNGEYLLRIPKDEVIEHDLHEGQLLAVVLESLQDFGTVDASLSEEPEPAWKLNESRRSYDTSG